MNQDGVSVALGLALEEIGKVRKQVEEAGAQAFRESRFVEARRLAAFGEKLLPLREELRKLKAEWKPELVPPPPAP